MKSQHLAAREKVVQKDKLAKVRQRV